MQSADWNVHIGAVRSILHSEFCILHWSRVGLLFPVNHAPGKMASLTGFAPVISCMRGSEENSKHQTPEKHQTTTFKTE